MTCRVINDFGLFVLIWLVQLIIYPSFEFTAASRFASWHLKYTGLITVFVVPLMFAQVGLLAWENSLFFSWKSATGAILVVSCWLVTFTLSVPTHSKLQAIGNDLETVRWLVLTNWPRTILCCCFRSKAGGEDFGNKLFFACRILKRFSLKCRLENSQ